MPFFIFSMKRLGLIAVLVSLSACVGSGGMGKTTEPPDTAAGNPHAAAPAIPTYPNGSQFCDGRVFSRGGGHISWVAYATEDARADVVAFYEKKLGTANRERSGDEDTWRFPRDTPKRFVAVQDASPDGPWRTCKVPDNTQAITMISSKP